MHGKRQNLITDPFGEGQRSAPASEPLVSRLKMKRLRIVDGRRNTGDSQRLADRVTAGNPHAVLSPGTGRVSQPGGSNQAAADLLIVVGCPALALRKLVCEYLQLRQEHSGLQRIKATVCAEPDDVIAVIAGAVSPD